MSEFLKPAMDTPDITSISAFATGFPHLQGMSVLKKRNPTTGLAISYVSPCRLHIPD
jgi:hypothetical protein